MEGVKDSQGKLLPSTLKIIKDQLLITHAKLMNECYDGDAKSRADLGSVIMTQFPELVKTEAQANYAVQEIVGLGILEELQQDPKNTDVGYNGSRLFRKTNNGFYYIKDPRVNDDYINRLLQRSASRVKKDFSKKEPRLSGQIGNQRLSARNQSMTVSGPTFSIRLSRPGLVMTEATIQDFCPPSIFRFFASNLWAHNNMLLAGDMGTGKTSFQKLVLSKANPEEKIILLEDEDETHAKMLFPDLNIYEWLVGPGANYEESIEDAFRNDAVWVMPSEIRGRETGTLVEGAIGGTHVFTTLHTLSAPMIPDRLLSMITKYHSVNEERMLKNIYSAFPIGGYLKKKKENGQTLRWLSEVIEFYPDCTARPIFRRKRRNGQFIDSFFPLSGQLLERYEDVDEVDTDELKEVFGNV
ncbi:MULTISPECIES: ATPase, T2SS/T4P/T4SS family [unclassified Sporolactobacillus]|uniref:ATPase, T2SS/T4P/T4SS family n=1 Tax=unclassified Sporolactobacillus TaxID=2628533 RepID=UPI0023683521|nr:ATPase, T2SS/T4P/T4SS family [Sporolactobacillus sp. CQH2019]MDD9150436.1 ATPase, T2SS/T4P/T4SS family [Sporolactobacillus sp. CQH2019]